MFPVFRLSGGPLQIWTYAMLVTCIEPYFTLLYIAEPLFTANVSWQRLAQDLALAIVRRKREFAAYGVIQVQGIHGEFLPSKW